MPLERNLHANDSQDCDNDQAVYDFCAGVQNLQFSADNESPEGDVRKMDEENGQGGPGIEFPASALLIFQCYRKTCDPQINSTLLRLKRLLHSRLQVCMSRSRSPDQPMIKPTLHVFTSAAPVPLQEKRSQERLRVQTDLPLTDKHKRALSQQILTCLFLKLGCLGIEANLSENAVTFVEIRPVTDSENLIVRGALPTKTFSHPAAATVVMMAFRGGTNETVIPDSVLAELCQSGSSSSCIAWESFTGIKYVNVTFVIKDAGNQGGEQTVMMPSLHSAERGTAASQRIGNAILMYYPLKLQPFLSHRALHSALQPGQMLHSMLAEHIDAFHFECLSPHLDDSDTALCRQAAAHG